MKASERAAQTKLTGKSNRKSDYTRFNVYRRTKEGGKVYYWASIPGTDKDGESKIYATIFVRMSKAAATAYDIEAETTDNPQIVRAYIECAPSDWWLKAVPGREGQYANVSVFINDFAPVED